MRETCKICLHKFDNKWALCPYCLNDSRKEESKS